MKKSAIACLAITVALSGCSSLIVESTDFYDDMKASVQTEVTTKENYRESSALDEFKTISDNSHSNIPRSDIETYYDRIGPEKMLDIIEQDSYCHDKGHNIGKEVFKRTGKLNEAMRICGQRCTSGCFHGILMEKFGQLSGNANRDDHVGFYQIEDEITQICNDKSIIDDIGVGDCVHGVGHAVMFLADYYTPRAIDACNLFKEESLAYYCATGVYMERDIVYGKEDRNEATPFYPCDEQRDHPAACYRYKIRRSYNLNQSNIDTIKSDCMALPSREERAGCFHGLGMAYFKWIKKEPSQLVTLCNSEDQLLSRLCMEGAIGKLTVYSREKSLEACKSYSGEMQDFCKQAYNTGNFGMNKDFSLYYYKPN